MDPQLQGGDRAEEQTPNERPRWGPASDDDGGQCDEAAAVSHTVGE